MAVIRVRPRPVDVDDLKAIARRRLPCALFEYIEGGALDESSVRANDDALGRLHLKQRVFVDATAVDTGTELLGLPVSSPVFVSPMGLLTLFHYAGDLAIAQVARSERVVLVHSSWSGSPIGEIVDAGGPYVWAQVALFKDRALVDHHIDMAAEAGVRVLVLPGDVNVSDKRPRDLHHGLDVLPPAMTVRDVVDYARHPEWVANFLRRTSFTLGNYLPNGSRLSMGEVKPFLHRMENPGADWSFVRHVRERWKGALVIKGVMCAEDAVLARNAGADAVIVSNHGGRQFHGQPGTAAVLPSVVDSAGEMHVFVDGGVTDGGQVLALLGLGARGVGVGRAVAWGLAAGGRPGVRLATTMLREELATAMGFTGIASIDDAGPQILAEAGA